MNPYSLLLGPIIGGLSHKRANLWGRSQGPGILHAWIGLNPDLSDARLAGRSMPLRAEDGYAGVAPISGLTPDTRYYYALTLQDAPPEPDAAPFPSFTSFPLPGQPRSFSFTFGSCFRPALEQGGEIFRGLEAFRLMDDLRFILLIGDQIYADDYIYNGLGSVACTLQDYRQVYEHTWSNPHFRKLLANLPAFMTLDDHEVDDDWTWTNLNRTQAQIPIWDRLIRLFRGRAPREWKIPAARVRDALQAFWEHQGMHAPPFQLPPRLNEEGQYALSVGDPGSLAYTFTFGAAAFFIMDTRTMRVKSRHTRTILGEGQWRALESWLLAVKDEYPIKFLVTSGALLFNMWIDIARDRWSGFPEERARLLHFLAANGITGVYLLTGDLHSSHAVRAELYGPQETALPIWEYCTSPFEQNPNLLSRRTYTPLRRGPIRSQDLLFNIAQNNFGVIRVDFPEQGGPQVCFEVYDEAGQILAEV
jgi:alkaline phosphatase D